MLTTQTSRACAHATSIQLGSLDSLSQREPGSPSNADATGKTAEDADGLPMRARSTLVSAWQDGGGAAGGCGGVGGGDGGDGEAGGNAGGDGATPKIDIVQIE